MQTEAVTPLLVSYIVAAALLGISEQTIRNQISKGTFPLKPVKIGGRSLIRLSDIHAFVANPTPVVASPDPVKRGRGRPRKIVVAREGGAV